MRKTPRRSAFFAATATAAVADGPLGFAERIASIPRLALDVLIGRYDGMTRGRLFLMLAAAFYIVSPVDLLPEAFLTLPAWPTTRWSPAGSWRRCSARRRPTPRGARAGTPRLPPIPGSSPAR